MLLRAATFFIGAVLFCSLSLRAQEKAPDETIKVETKLISVPTTVSDRNGRYIPNLTAADFQIFQDGVQQNIEFFAATEEPITVALLIDTSQSTRPVLSDIKDSAKSFIKLLTPADRAMIVSFDFAAHILSPLTNDQEKLKNAIKSAEIPKQLAGTTLRDAVYDTINTSFKGLTGRKAIILLTDGKDFGSRISRETLLFRLEESDTLVYTVFFKTDNRPQRPMFGRRRGSIFGRGFPPIGWPDRRDDRQRERVEQQNSIAEAFLQQLSDLTAGRLYSSKDGKLKKTFAAIVEELRFQYRLGFYPAEEPGDPAVHNLRVKVLRPDVSVRSRGSYRTQNK